MSRELALATNNAGKIIEFRELFRELPYELKTPAELGIKLDVAEDGQTYEENARLKALALARLSGLLSIGDDSGLEIDALNGEPGVRSSRYAGENASDNDRVNFLLHKLADIPLERRTARFCCVIAVAAPDGRVKLSFGECHGIILMKPRGRNGFGYDPVFLFPELGKTMAQLPSDIKNVISHRGRAARGVQELLRQLETD